MDFWKTQFDKLLLTIFLGGFSAVVILVAKWFGADSEVFKWSVNSWLFFSGLFGGLVSGFALGKAVGKNEGDNK